MKMSSIGGGGGGGSSGADGGNRNSRNNYSYSFPQFSLRRFLLESARAARGSPPLSARLCDMERGNNVKYDKNHSSSSNSSNSNNNNNNNNNNNATAINGTPLASSSTHHVHPQLQLPYHLPHHHHHHVHKNTTDNASQNSVSSPSNCTASSNHQRVLSSPIPDLQSDTYCPLCYNEVPPNELYTLLSCKHAACLNCLESYLMIEIFESRTDIACPECTDSMHPSDIQAILKAHPEFVNKYEDFMVRRVLLNDTDSRWCPAPDCSYAVIATGCASCPRIKCERPGCDVNFCYHCKAEWHPDQTCDAARASRQSPMRAPSGSISQDSQHRDDIKPCPRCQVLIVKMDDGSCNHMVCAVCGSEFCWLCMKEVSDLHYLSPSGCTFWGKKPWSRKKKLLWQLGTLVGAPVGIALVAGIAVPAMIIGIPVWVGRKIHEKYKSDGKHKRNSAVLGGVTASILVSPVLAGLAVAIGVPILLFYVYGVVPVSLCRAGCGVSTSRDGFKFDVDEDDTNSRNQDAGSVDAISRIGATSIGEFSLSVASGSHLGVSSGGGGGGGGGVGSGVVGLGGGIAAAGGSNLGGIGGTGGAIGSANGDNSNVAIGGSNGINGGTHQPFQIIGHSSKCESTTALAGSITGHRLEVQADVSSSETASAVTCVSEKSTNALNDTASTRALAGSILSYKQQLDSSNVSEDGVSERVRFDSTICYVGEGKKQHLSDIPFMQTLDQDIGGGGGDKASVSSGRSFRSSERSYRDEMDSTSLSSAYNNPIINNNNTNNNNNNNNKRTSIFSRIPKLNTSQHRNLPSSLDGSGNKGSKNIPEFESPEFLHHHLNQQQTPNNYQHHHHSHHPRQHHSAQHYNNNHHHNNNNNNNNNHHHQTFDNNNKKLSNLHNNNDNTNTNTNTNTNSNYCSNSDKQSFINVPYNNLNDSPYKDVYNTGGGGGCDSNSTISSTINNKTSNAINSITSKQDGNGGDNTNTATSTTSSSSSVSNRKNNKSQMNHKNMSKVAILRNLFFSKNNNNNNPNDFDDDDDNNNNNNDSASNSKS